MTDPLVALREELDEWMRLAKEARARASTRSMLVDREAEDGYAAGLERAMFGVRELLNSIEERRQEESARIVGWNGPERRADDTGDREPIADCHCQHRMGTRCMYASTAGGGSAQSEAGTSGETAAARTPAAASPSREVG